MLPWEGRQSSVQWACYLPSVSRYPFIHLGWEEQVRGHKSRTQHAARTGTGFELTILGSWVRGSTTELYMPHVLIKYYINLYSSDCVKFLFHIISFCSHLFITFAEHCSLFTWSSTLRIFITFAELCSLFTCSISKSSSLVNYSQIQYWVKAYFEGGTPPQIKIEHVLGAISKLTTLFWKMK